MSNKLVLLLILLLFLLLSGLMLFDNSGHQPVVLGIVDPFFFLISYATLSIIFWSLQENRFNHQVQV